MWRTTEGCHHTPQEELQELRGLPERSRWKEAWCCLRREGGPSGTMAGGLNLEDSRTLSSALILLLGLTLLQAPLPLAIWAEHHPLAWVPAIAFAQLSRVLSPLPIHVHRGPMANMQPSSPFTMPRGPVSRTEAARPRRNEHAHGFCPAAFGVIIFCSDPSERRGAPKSTLPVSTWHRHRTTVHLLFSLPTAGEVTPDQWQGPVRGPDTLDSVRAAELRGRVGRSDKGKGERGETWGPRTWV